MELKLSDNTIIDNLIVNGTDLVSPVQVDDSALTVDNLANVEIDGKSYKNLTFVRQAQYPDGWHICLRELTQAELDQINNDLAIVTIYEMLLG